LRLVVLGCGTGVPSASRVASGYWLEAAGARLRLDCGPGTVHAMARHGVDWRMVTHQWISHFHLDHALEIPALLFALKHGRGDGAPARGPLTFVGPRGLRRLVEDLVEAFASSELLAQAFPVVLTEVEDGGTLELGAGAVLRVASTPHTGESLALRVEAGGRALGYTGDTAPSDALADFFRDVDLLLAECSFVDDNRGTKHLVADETAALAAASRARHLVAVHAYFDPDRARLADRLARHFPGEITIATDGAAFEI
jgi:ribonuclease BN (tRNA processing enzyme)